MLRYAPYAQEEGCLVLMSNVLLQQCFMRLTVGSLSRGARGVSWVMQFMQVRDGINDDKQERHLMEVHTELAYIGTSDSQYGEWIGEVYSLRARQ